MTQYLVGQVIDYRQVTHCVPMEDCNGMLPVHPDPQSGRGKVVATVHIKEEWRVIVLPDSEIGKKEKVTLLLRIPPDEAGVV